MAHNHSISLADAAKLTKTYRQSPISEIVQALTDIKAETFVREAIDELMDQSGCEGLRIYYGVDLLPFPKFRLVLVGVDANEDDMELGVILENGKLCPPDCGSNSQLNS